MKTTIIPAQPGQFCVELYPCTKSHPHIQRLPVVAWRVIRFREGTEPDFVPAPTPITITGLPRQGMKPGGWVLIELPDGHLAYEDGFGNPLMFKNVDAAVEAWAQDRQRDSGRLQAEAEPVSP
jgi:hypothetical protein